MNIRRYIVVGSVMLALLMIPDTVAQELQPANPRGSTATVAPDGGIIVDGKYFESWQAYWQSDFFRDAGMRCGTVLGEGPPTRDASDCDLNYTDPAFIYSPFLMRYRIPVVVHVIRADDGVTGHITPELVQSQIDVLNEDCRAIAGTNGANGTDVEIEFYLATTDPDGNPTSGITYSDNTDWFNDTGNYWDSLAWDPHNYLNIYTNMAGGGAYANIPQAPALGDIGSNADRIVILWSVFGRPGAGGPPYDLGRTATHEVGHYLGLYHPFQGGCQDPNTPNCYSNGDCICDTNPDQEATFLCPAGAKSCDGYLIPIENYMEYTNDACMEEFTPEQARRMRCTLEFWRPDLFEPMTIWADFCYSGSQDGSYDRPFNTLAQALVEVPFGGTIKMKPSSTAETPVINQAVTLEAFEGSVVIGQ